MALTAIVIAWTLVALWFVGWELMASGVGAPGAETPSLIRRFGAPAGEALWLTLLAALWFGSLGSGAWPVPFALLGLLSTWRAALDALARGGVARMLVRLVGGTSRMLVAGALLAWRLP